MLISFFFSGLLSWDQSACYVDLERELASVNENPPQAEELRGGQIRVLFSVSLPTNGI